MLAYNCNHSIQKVEINTGFLNGSLTYFLIKGLELTGLDLTNFRLASSRNHLVWAAPY